MLGAQAFFSSSFCDLHFCNFYWDDKTTPPPLQPPPPNNTLDLYNSNYGTVIIISFTSFGGFFFLFQRDFEESIQHFLESIETSKAEPRWVGTSIVY